MVARYGLTGTSTNLSPVLTRTRRATGVEGELGRGRAVALSPGRSPLAPWSVPAFGGAPVTLAGVLVPGGGALVSLGGRLISLGVMLGSRAGSRAAVSVASEGPLVSRCRGVVWPGG